MADSNGSSTPNKYRGLRPPWKPGETGNPNGRTVGSRNKLGEAFIDALFADFQANGIAAIVACREASPEAYIRVIAGLMPQKFQADVVHRFVALMPAPARTVSDWEHQHSPKTINGTTQ